MWDVTGRVERVEAGIVYLGHSSLSQMESGEWRAGELEQKPISHHGHEAHLLQVWQKESREQQRAKGKGERAKSLCQTLDSETCIFGVHANSWCREIYIG